jgi:hypothetical protein
VVSFGLTARDHEIPSQLSIRVRSVPDEER